MPLDLRREELGLRYTMRLKTSSKNPTFKILGECNNRIFGQRSSKPFQIRQLERLNNPVIQRQKVLAIEYPKIPPWIMPSINYCKKKMSKKNASDKVIRSMFLEHDIEHQGQEKIYTDGSKSDDGVGCAVIYKNTSYVVKLPDSASVHTAELTAIVKALKLIHNSPHKKFVIYSDSQGALQSLNIFNSFHPLIQEAQEWLFKIKCRFKSVCFCWVPSHVGIKGNEKADQ